MLNLKNIGFACTKNTSAVKYLYVIILIICFCSFHPAKHPFYMGVTEIKYEAPTRNLNISVKLFTNDLETALRNVSKKNIDILNPKNKSEVDSVLCAYIQQRLAITLNQKNQSLIFIGYEKEEESIWTFFEIKKVPLPKTIIVYTKLLYDYLPQQINIIHAEVNGSKKSSKVANPDSKVEFSF